MSTKSSIEWTEATWNPTTGCTKVSPGCKNCYAEKMAKRLRAMGQKNYQNGFELAVHKQALEIPMTWRSPKTIFVNSMSDLFHENVSADFIERVFQVMREAQHHLYQVLTKRGDRLSQLDSQGVLWPENLWLGVSVETQDYVSRIDHLKATRARCKFVSLEPLLGPLSDLDLVGIDWVIVGGESGPGARPMDSSWVIGIRGQCLEAKIPFFFKQWGTLANNPDPSDPTAKRNGGHAKGGKLLEGRVWDEMPNRTT